MLDRPKSDLLSQVANIAGIGSLVMALASTNVGQLSNLQRWGLTLAAVILVWLFMMAALVRVASSVSNYSSLMDGKSLVALIGGGLVLGGVLLAVVPFFAFGLPPQEVEKVSIGAAVSFPIVATLIAVLIIVDRSIN